MRQFHWLLVMLLILPCTHVLAQQRTVSGVINASDTKAPLFGVTVMNRNTNKVVQTNGSGFFTIAAEKGHVLVISYVGFATKQVTVTDDPTIKVELKAEDNAMNEVEVTALNIPRNNKSLGYATQKIKGEDIANSQRDNLLTALAGRVAGVTVTTSTGMPGASVSVMLRGAVSMDGNNQPLFVIDGMPVDNSTFSQANSVVEAPNRNNDYGNRLADINPNDLESLVILKGPEATALYGNAGASGAIIITTKRAKTGRASVSYDNAFRLEKITRFPEIQQQYGRGTAGIASPLTRTFLGPKYASDATIYDNIHTFFKTGQTRRNNLSVDAGNERASYRLSTSLLDQEGVVPQTGYSRFSTRLTATATLSPRIDVQSSFNYVSSKTRKATKGQFGFLLSLLTWPSDDNVEEYMNADGTRREIAPGSTTEIDNPFWDVNKNKSEDKVEHFIGNVNLTYKAARWFTLKATVGVDQYTTNGFTLYHPESRQGINTGGNIETFSENNKLYTGQFTGIINKTFGKLTNQLAAGFTFDQRNYGVSAIRGEKFMILDYLSMNVTDPATQRTRLTNNRVRNVGWFAQWVGGYNDIVFLTLSGRYDGASTLVHPGEELSARTSDAFFFYPAASLSFNYSEFDVFKQMTWLDYAKLRVSAGKAGKTARTPYITNNRYVPVQTSGGGFSLNVYAGNPRLKPEFTTNIEIGTEMKFLKNRLGIDVAYYHMTSKNQITAPRTSYATGNILVWLNGGTIQNQGVEIMLNATPIKTKNLSWEVLLNFDKNKNKITAMPADLPQFYISDYDIVPFGGVKAFYRVGGSLTALGVEGNSANRFARNKDGKLLINPSSGLPIRETVPNLLMDRNPDFKLGYINTIKFRNLTFSMNFDIKVGGDVFNANGLVLNNVGLGLRTQDRETPRVIEGVLKDGLEDSPTPTKNTITVVPYYQNGYYNDIYNIEDYFERDIHWIRLRDATLNYNFTSHISKKQKFIKSASVFITGTDLFMLTNYTGVDPNVSALTAAAGGYGGMGFDYGALAMPMGLNFGLKLGF